MLQQARNRIRNLPQLGRRRLIWAGAAVAVGVVALAIGLGGVSRHAEPQSKGTPASMRLLTQQQYLNTLSYVFGPNVQPTTRFAALPRTDGLLASGAAAAGLTEAQLEMYQKTAAKAAAQIIKEGSREYLIPCIPAKRDAADPDCARTFIAQVAPAALPPERTGRAHPHARGGG